MDPVVYAYVQAKSSETPKQRALPFDDFTRHHHSHVSADGSHRSIFYTVERHLWITVSQLMVPVVPDGDLGPIFVTATNTDLEPWGDEQVEKAVHLREFPNTDDGWEGANEFARDVLVIFQLLDRKDDLIDHYIAATRAVLHESKKRAPDLLRTA